MPRQRKPPPFGAVVYWTLWLALFFLPAELFAAFLTPGKADTFSEFTWWLTENKRWKRAVVLAFGIALVGHLVWQWTVIPVAAGGAGFGLLIVLALRRQARIEEVSMSPFWKKVLVAAGYAVGPAYGVFKLAFGDGTITPHEWVLVGEAFAFAFWGTFKSNTTVIRPSRKGESFTKIGPGS